MSNNNRRKFRNLLINRPYQLRYVYLIAATGLWLSLLNTGVFYIYTKENYQLLVELSPMTDEARNQLNLELRHIAIWLSLFSVGFTVALAFIGLYFSHRSAGPLYHFKKVFEEIANGKREARVKLRPKDDFQEVAESFNRMMDRISSK